MTKRYTNSEQFLSLAIVIILAATVGILFGLLYGYKFKGFWKIPAFTIKPALHKIQIPCLVNHIITGMIVRNFFGQVMNAYPAVWARWLRSCILAILLTRGGMQIVFKGQGLQVALIAIIPIIVEANVMTLMSYYLFDMPLTYCYTLGFSISTVATGILVPAMISLNDQGFGRAKGIPGLMIAANSFDSIICIVLSGIVITLSINQAEEEVTGIQKDISWQVGYIFIQIAVGLASGALFGTIAWIFKFINEFKYVMYMRSAYCIIIALGFVFAFEMNNFSNATFIACLSFGYTCSRFWGTLKPNKELGNVFWALQPFMFGTVGASLQFSQIRAKDVGESFGIILVGVPLRLLSVFLVTWGKKYSIKERILMGISFGSKGTLTATLSSVLSVTLKQKGPAYEEFSHYAQNIQTTAVLSIIIFSPVISTLTSSLGPVLLENDNKNKQMETKDTIQKLTPEESSNESDKLEGKKVQQIQDDDEQKEFSQINEKELNPELGSVQENTQLQENNFEISDFRKIRPSAKLPPISNNRQDTSGIQNSSQNIENQDINNVKEQQQNQQYIV